jgi:hypothetical protein
MGAERRETPSPPATGITRALFAGVPKDLAYHRKAEPSPATGVFFLSSAPGRG